MTVTPDAVEAAASTREVRDDFIAHRSECYRDGYSLMNQDAPTDDEAGTVFDRWLAEHDAQVAKQTLLDAAQALPMDCYDPRHMADFITARAATLTPKDTP